MKRITRAAMVLWTASLMMLGVRLYAFEWYSEWEVQSCDNEAEAEADCDGSCADSSAQRSGISCTEYGNGNNFVIRCYCS